MLLGGAESPTDQVEGLVLRGVHHFEETLLASVLTEPDDRGVGEDREGAGPVEETEVGLGQSPDRVGQAPETVDDRGRPVRHDPHMGPEGKFAVQVDPEPPHSHHGGDRDVIAVEADFKGWGLVIFPPPREVLDLELGDVYALGARGQLPSGSILSTWRVLKQFAQLLPSG